MQSETGYRGLIDKLKAYKKKYYQNQLIKGAIFCLACILGVFILFSTLEFSLRLASPLRAILFFAFILIFAGGFYYWVAIPLSKLFNLGKTISDEQAATQIGRFFPEVDDKLLNTLQLQKDIQKDDAALLRASIEQKTKEISIVPFTNAVDFTSNKKYLKYLYVPVGVILSIGLLLPGFFSESTSRIVQYKKDFVPEAPFAFVLENESLNAFRNEDFHVKLRLDGNALPENTYLVSNGLRIKMQESEPGQYLYTYNKIQKEAQFYFEAAGFSSVDNKIQLIDRPNLHNFSVALDYPRYTQKKDEKFDNTGSLLIPQGTSVKWRFTTTKSDKLSLHFASTDSLHETKLTGNQSFEYEKRFFTSDEYSVVLKNQYSNNKDRIAYDITVVPDIYPKIKLEQFQDTTLYQFLVLGGNITDDYGFSRMNFYYAKVDQAGQQNPFTAIPIEVSPSQTSQSFYYQFTIDSALNLQEGDKLAYYLRVWDNDAVNGRKSTKTGVFHFQIPKHQDIRKSIDKSIQNTENQIDKTLNKAQELKEKLEEAENRLKGEKQLTWQDEKAIQELLEKRESLNQAIEELKEQNKANSMKRERFSKQNENIKDKAKQIQQLMDELLDDETKQLYEELQRLLDEQMGTEDIQEVLDELNKKETNLEKELERTLELFKRLKFDYKLEETINDLEEASKKQEELSEETLDKSNEMEGLQDKQEEVTEDFKEIEEDIKKLEELNQDLESPNPMEDSSGEQEEIDQEQQESQESLDKNKRKPASKSQKKAAQQMKSLSKKMQQMQSNMDMSMMQENLDNLRDIVDNLVKLSFSQETLMKDFRQVNQTDPRYIQLSQTQLKLKDDAKIIEDSLLSLSKRVFQIASFVTREVGEMNENMDESVQALKERKQPLAISKQQFAMTSMNNLALLLDNVLEQMQQQMADATGQGQPKKGGKNMPGLSQLQKQLNQQIRELQKSGKSGRQLSEELAKLAAEQEKIRQALQEMEKDSDNKKPGGQGGNGDLLEQMEETEEDLVNKKIDRETLARQQEILTRLLEAENALKERELDDERKGETANQYEKVVPKAFEDYIKAKEKEIELLKTIPPKLNPYYKKEVHDYFNRVNNR